MIEYLTATALSLMIYFSASLYVSLLICNTFSIPDYIAFILTAFAFIIPAAGFTKLLDKIFRSLPKDTELKNFDIFKEFAKKNPSIDCSIWNIGYPLLFHYRSVLGKVRIIISSGLLKNFEEHELNLFLIRETEKIKLRSNFLLGVISFFPFCLRHVSSFLHVLGLRHKAVGGAGSIASLACALTTVSKFIYCIVWFTSRALDRYLESKNKLKIPYETQIKLVNLCSDNIPESKESELISSLDFLELSDFKVPFYISRGDQKQDCNGSGWQDYFELFHSKPLLGKSQTKIPDLKQRQKSYNFFASVVILSFICAALIVYGIPPWAVTLVLSVMLLKLHFEQYSLKRNNLTLEQHLTNPNPVKGFPIKVKNKAKLYNVQISYESNVGFLLNETFIPLHFSSFSKPENSFSSTEEEAEFSGWVRFGETVFLDCAFFSIGKKTVYSNNPIWSRLMFDLLLMAISIIMIAFQIKEGL